MDDKVIVMGVIQEEITKLELEIKQSTNYIDNLEWDLNSAKRGKAIQLERLESLKRFVNQKEEKK